MELPNYTSRGSVTFNMTPMIDVVFLLIIFFLVSSHLAQRENRVPVSLPAAASGESNQQTEDSARVTLSVLPAGELLLGGTPIESQSLTQRLRALRQSKGPDLEVRIRADRAVAYRDVGPILVAASKSQIWNVTFAVLKSEGSR